MYSFTMFWVSWLKYYTFNATFLDLGLSNHIYWLLSHGGLGAYTASGFASVYPIQYEESMYFLVTPLYALAPGINLLLALQACALGLSAVPLFFLARRHLRAEWIPVLIVGVYLTYFAITSANLFDFHNEALFPLLFFSAVFAYDSGRKGWFALFAALAAIIDPLALLLVVFFTLTTYVPRVGQPIIAKLATTFRTVRSRPEETALLLSLLGLLVLYELSGTLYGSFAGTGGGARGPLDVVLYSVNYKLEMFLFLFGALAFLPLLEWRAVFVLLPYVGFVFYTTDSAHWATFGLQYALLATPPLFYGLVLALERLAVGPGSDPSVVEYAAGGTLATARARRAAVWRRQDRVLARSRPVRALVLVALLFGLVYFPLSPINQDVAGGYFEGQANLPGITAVTPQVRFLWQLVDLIPPSASVLTQNNIPQLSGRAHLQTPATLDPATPYNFILLDLSLSYFADADQLLPVAEGALENGSFGILGEGQAALLLERGYAGAPALFQPTEIAYLGSQLSPFDATLNGSALVGGASAPWMWYGPYATFFPGTYAVNFTLSSNATAPKGSLGLTLDVVSQGGAVIYAQAPVYLGNFTSIDVPTVFHLIAVLPGVTSRVELRGVDPTGAASLTLWSVTATQTSYVS